MRWWRNGFSVDRNESGGLSRHYCSSRLISDTLFAIKSAHSFCWPSLLPLDLRQRVGKSRGGELHVVTPFGSIAKWDKGFILPKDKRDIIVKYRCLYRVISMLFPEREIIDSLWLANQPSPAAHFFWSFFSSFLFFFFYTATIVIFSRSFHFFCLLSRGGLTYRKTAELQSWRGKKNKKREPLNYVIVPLISANFNPPIDSASSRHPLILKLFRYP